MRRGARRGAPHATGRRSQRLARHRPRRRPGHRPAVVPTTVPTPSRAPERDRGRPSPYLNAVEGGFRPPERARGRFSAGSGLGSRPQTCSGTERGGVRAEPASGLRRDARPLGASARSLYGRLPRPAGCNERAEGGGTWRRKGPTRSTASPPPATRGTLRGQASAHAGRPTGAARPPRRGRRLGRPDARGTFCGRFPPLSAPAKRFAGDFRPIPPPAGRPAGVRRPEGGRDSNSARPRRRRFDR